eukprot:CAMPEP_0174283284 /NCGR_PEP_ID=MMETSP0809-20121228/3952_1 /TAXON_ID=73025 ORGANISM="Eutreptiella gymnastica-like, Strain CCMP1594" /NCGR_SAMPLE_ID=MMETSP0809 /ASSEMBLY_ACC=CAM_ASM_000658 /LENGTH=67 /DNA_ID=CAMNT_0015378111 /DNA_START=77 /DNA_END=276 /DNA_ORIENTATION=-
MSSEEWGTLAFRGAAGSARGAAGAAYHRPPIVARVLWDWAPAAMQRCPCDNPQRCPVGWAAGDGPPG